MSNYNWVCSFTKIHFFDVNQHHLSESDEPIYTVHCEISQIRGYGHTRLDTKHDAGYP